MREYAILKRVARSAMVLDVVVGVFQMTVLATIIHYSYYGGFDGTLTWNRDVVVFYTIASMLSLLAVVSSTFCLAASRCLLAAIRLAVSIGADAFIAFQIHHAHDFMLNSIAIFFLLDVARAVTTMLALAKYDELRALKIQLYIVKHVV
ncbi:unnamed protein product [Caenorhabditis bovis]|uniref:Uncharacterized protein n=1 Tax=Caenorhabditis bovis TaxID=2654633 RepID=A0A8S1EXR5_9PELO|nr:unnamed protein product [Caenorhabditis bovis]